MLAVAVVLTAVAVAAAGPIAFVVLRGRARSPAPATAAGPPCSAPRLVGAVVVVGADYVADYLLLDVNFPVGVVTGAFGAPFLLWLLARGRTGRKS